MMFTLLPVGFHGSGGIPGTIRCVCGPWSSVSICLYFVFYQTQGEIAFAYSSMVYEVSTVSLWLFPSASLGYVIMHYLSKDSLAEQ